MYIAKALLGLVPALLLTASSFAQTTGKLTGTVTDAATGEPLPGVNVVIEGTTQGTATDLNGEYVIIGVRPGVYTLVASYIGFTTQRKEGVRVSVDLTTEVDFALSEEVLEGEEVVITAEAVTVRKDLTASEARVTAETIENLPVQEVGDILRAQAGITTSGSGIHIRGGRSSEIAYFVDGVRVSDAYDGSIAVDVETDGIQELQVISGTFNAEYGQAMSGIINVVTKEGTDTFGGSIEAYSGSYVADQGSIGEAFLLGRNPGDYTVDGIQYLDAQPFGYLEFNPTQYYNVQGTLEGPLPLNGTFYATGRYFHNEGWFYGARLFNANGTPGDSALVPMNPYDKLSGQVNLKYRLSPNLALNVLALGSYENGNDLGIGNERYQRFRWNPEGVPQFYDRGYNLNVKLTHTLGAKTFYTVNVANYYKNYQRYLYEDPFDPRYNGWLIDAPDSVVTGGQRFLRGGTDLGRADRSTNSYLLKGDITSQVARHHLVKSGFEARMDFLQNESYSLRGQVDPETGLFMGTPEIPDRATGDYSSFDEDPITVSAYVQDKIEYENFIVNAGVRLDYFDPRSVVPADAEDPNVYNPFKDVNKYRDLNGNGAIEAEERTPGNLKTVEERQAYWWQSTERKVQVSPRLGVAYPITESGVIHFSYGHFFQIPTFNRLFENPDFVTLSINTGIYGPYGNPDLNAEKTVMYEIGLQQGIGPVVLDVTGFYRDVRNWVSTSVAIPTASPDISYVVFTNRDYSNVRGVTLKASKPFSDHYSFDLNYTFQMADGTNSDPSAEFFALQNGDDPTVALLPLDWDQRHTASASVYVGANGWGLSTLARYGSGYPYTPFFGQAETRGQNVSSNFPQNSRRKPTSLAVDLYAFKDLNLGGVRPRIFVQVYNLFDAGNPTGVFGDTGLPDVTLEQKRVGAFDPGWFVRPDFYAEPRRIQVGIDLNF